MTVLLIIIIVPTALALGLYYFFPRQFRGRIYQKWLIVEVAALLTFSLVRLFVHPHV